MKPRRWLLGLLTLAGCAPPVQPPLGSERIELPMHVEPLPGGLDQEPMLHSNSPEQIETAGVLVSTLPGEQGPFLNKTLVGRSSVFLHHIARFRPGDSRRLWIGLIGHNRTAEKVQLELIQGNAFTTRPDALFIDLLPLQANDGGLFYAGPGDRCSLESLRGHSNLNPRIWPLEPGSDQVLWQQEIKTSLLEPGNGLSALLRLHSSGAAAFSLVAVLASDAPQLEDYLELIRLGQRAGPLEPDVTPYDPEQPPSGGAFRYGRVAALAQGAAWNGELKIDASQDFRRGYPLSSLYLKRLGTGQNQSAALLARVPGTAIEAHGNYGVHYRLRLDLSNSGPKPRRLELALQQPSAYESGQVRFMHPPLPAIRFRGSLKVTQGSVSHLYHFVLHEGEQLPPFAGIELSPGTNQELLLEWIYPADSTPPQLLEIRAQG